MLGFITLCPEPTEDRPGSRQQPINHIDYGRAGADYLLLDCGGGAWVSVVFLFQNTFFQF